jgi:hypothetical protein
MDMKTACCLGALAALALGAAATAHADVDISVAIRGEIAPGVYGRVDLGGRPPPPVVYAKPVLIEPPPPHVVVAEPLYLHVPPEHARDWLLHCQEYHACNRQVYFVKSVEYDPAYIRAHERARYEQIKHEERREDQYDHDHR